MFTFGALVFRHLITIKRPRICTSTMKPPNILIKTNNTDTFTQLKQMLLSLLEQDRYTIYQLDDERFHKQPWMDSCALLFYTLNDGKTEILEKVGIKLNAFINKGNRKVLCYDIKDTISKKLWCRQYGFKEEFLEDGYKLIKEDELKILILKSIEEESKLRRALLELGFELKSHVTNKNESSPSVFHGYFLDSLQRKLEDVFDMELARKYISFHEYLPKAMNDNTLHVITNVNNCKNFNWTGYIKALKTDTYGRSLIFTDVIGSTQTFLQNLDVKTITQDGFVVTAKQQSRGKGRTGNVWLSPLGCMMFSLKIMIPINSNLGRSLPLIQHLVVVAFVKSIKEKTGYEVIDLNIKWPNDIYVNKQIKIGGVVVNSTAFENMFHIVIGLGVNICNEKPTVCLNQVIDEYSRTTGTFLKQLTIEDCLAGTISQIEMLVKEFQQFGVKEFKKAYYKYWLHSDSTVTLQDHDNMEAVVIGIDDFGYLQVKTKNGGEIATLQPDGNTFDMMTNMISIKQR